MQDLLELELCRSWGDGMPEEPRRPQKEAEDKDNSKVMNGLADVTLAMGKKKNMELCQRWS